MTARFLNPYEYAILTALDIAEFRTGDEVRARIGRMQPAPAPEPAHLVTFYRIMKRLRRAAYYEEKSAKGAPLYRLAPAGDRALTATRNFYTAPSP